MAEMPPVYFETRFRVDAPVGNWPSKFAIVTAYAPTGQHWAPERSLAADGVLKTELLRVCGSVVRVTGYSPSTGHAEPGWAASVPFDLACDLGRAFLQDAVYYVTADELFVTFCDERRALVPVGPFRERVTHD